jgi:hypothetical protein
VHLLHMPHITHLVRLPLAAAYLQYVFLQAVSLRGHAAQCQALLLDLCLQELQALREHIAAAEHVAAT